MKTSVSIELNTLPLFLQYVDDLMLAAATEKECQEATSDLLQTLGTLGYRASAKKAQIAKQEVTYLGKDKTGPEVPNTGYKEKPSSRSLSRLTLDK